ncbi:hypothetical protein ACFXPQ_28685 [Streptomyces lydicus]
MKFSRNIAAGFIVLAILVTGMANSDNAATVRAAKAPVAAGVHDLSLNWD